MLRKIFDLDNPFMRALSKVADLVALNVLFLLCSAPIVTVGASAAALYSMALKMVRNEEPSIGKGFFKAFKENLKQGIFFGVLFTLAFAAVILNLILFENMDSWIFQMVKAVCIAVGVLAFLLSLYVFPIIARFEMCAKDIFRNAVLMSVAYLPKTLLMAALYIPTAALMFWSEMTMFILLSAYIVFGFALMAFLKSFILRKIFSKYEPEESEELEELR